MPDFISFFVVLFAGIIFSEIFRRFHLPWVVALIIGGIIVGPSVLGIFSVNDTLDFIGQIGLIFLMFMAGLETRFSKSPSRRSAIIIVAIINGMIPFLSGIVIGLAFGYGLEAALLIGAIFISSSIAVVIPSLDAHGVLHTRLGETIVSTTIIQDVASLLFLSVFFQISNPATTLPLVILYPLLFFLLVIIRWLLPKIRELITKWSTPTSGIFQRDLRIVFTILFGTVIIFELLGLHPIIAGFFAGFVLSGHISSGTMMEKLRTMSYGLFIPVFFIIVGAQIDVTSFANARQAILLIAVVSAGSIAAKYFSGLLGGRAAGFSMKASKLLGSSSIPQLSTTLAVAFIGLELDIFDHKLVTSIIFLSVVTTVVGPILIGKHLAVFKKRDTLHL